MCCDMKTPYAVAERMLPQMKRMKSHRICHIVWSIVFFNHRSLSVGQYNYEADVAVSIVYFILDAM